MTHEVENRLVEKILILKHRKYKNNFRDLSDTTKESNKCKDKEEERNNGAKAI